MPELSTAYRFDEDGFYMGPDAVTEGILPPDDVMTAPNFQDGFWPRWNGAEWESVLLPTTAESFAEAGIVVEHEKHTPYMEELRRRILSAGADASPGGWALVQDEATNDLSVVRVPDLTEAEKALAADEAADAELALKIADVKERALSALLTGDEEWLSELKAEYAELLEGTR